MGTNPIETPASTMKPAFITAKGFLGRKRRLAQQRTGPSGALTPRCREPLPADHRSCASGPGQRHSEELAEGDPRRGRDCRRSKDRKVPVTRKKTAKTVPVPARSKTCQCPPERPARRLRRKRRPIKSPCCQPRKSRHSTLTLRTRRKSWGRGQFQTRKLTLIL